MNISIVARVIAVTLVCALAPQLGLADTVYTYNFNNLNGADAYIHGQDGWVGNPTTGMRARTTGVDVRAATMSTGTGAGPATAYRNSSADAAWPFKNMVTTFRLEWYATLGNNTRFSEVGLCNASGVPFFVAGGSNLTWRFISYANTITTSATIPNTPSYQFYDCRIDVDLVAGTASFSKRTHLTGSFAAVAGMQNINMQLPVGFVPADLKGLFLRSRDQGAIDDIYIEYVVESPAGTVITIR